MSGLLAAVADGDLIDRSPVLHVQIDVGGERREGRFRDVGGLRSVDDQRVAGERSVRVELNEPVPTFRDDLSALDRDGAAELELGRDRCGPVAFHLAAAVLDDTVDDTHLRVERRPQIHNRRRSRGAGLHDDGLTGDDRRRSRNDYCRCTAVDCCRSIRWIVGAAATGGQGDDGCYAGRREQDTRDSHVLIYIILIMMSQ
ncbi:MAG: hypothetical protein JWP06_154 [Candidatus Saccharibacteria bacterium]|nr:hypothetical protein [Candidatus Saccharibacteria bacterium]